MRLHGVPVFTESARRRTCLQVGGGASDDQNGTTYRAKTTESTTETRKSGTCRMKSITPQDKKCDHSQLLLLFLYIS